MSPNGFAGFRAVDNVTLSGSGHITNCLAPSQYPHSRLSGRSTRSWGQLREWRVQASVHRGDSI